MPLNKLAPFFRYWRTATAHDREAVDAVVDDAHVGPSPEFREALRGWPGLHYWSRREGPNRLVLVRALRTPGRERWGLHIGLFLLTFLTVWMAGAIFVAGPRLQIPPGADLAGIVAAGWDWIASSTAGMGFAAALMGILLAHEMGHYVTARRYLINASPPYFLPAPPQIAFIGTFGAFIRLRSPVVDRRQLLDVGAAGPWAGMVVAVVLLAFGLANSEVIPDVSGPSQQLIFWGRDPYYLGDTILLTWMRGLVGAEGTLELHPLALAGWFGVLVTMLNLFPLGQLDGGHIVFALIGKHQAHVGRLMWYGLVILGFQFSGWWLWAGLILLLGRGRVAHPSVLEPERPVPWSRWPLGVATAVLFILTFSADPLPSVPSFF